MVKNLPAKARDAGDAGSIQGWEDHLEEKMTPVILPRKEEPGGLWWAMVHSVTKNGT